MPARLLITALISALVAVTVAGCDLEEPADPGIAAVSPVITYAGIDSVDATELTALGYVEGVSEAGGECRFTFWAENGGASRLVIEGTPESEPDADPEGARTACGPVSIDAAQLPPGTYSAVLTYESVTSAGVSKPVPMELP